MKKGANNSRYIKKQIQLARAKDDLSSNTQASVSPDASTPALTAAINKSNFKWAKYSNRTKSEIEKRKDIFENAFKRAQAKANNTRVDDL